MNNLLIVTLLSCSPDSIVEDTSINIENVVPNNESTDDFPLVFAASDVEQSTVELTLEWFDVAKNEWFTEDSFGTEHELYSPTYLVMTGDDLQATIDLEQRYCDHLYEHHENSVLYSRCNENNTDPNCEHGICLFTEYALNGGAGIASSRQNDGYHLMIMASKNPSPEEESYRRVVLHEVFHIFQLSQHTETDYLRSEEIQGRLSGDHNEHVPWWMEGVAEYASILLYAQQEGVDSNYIQNEYRNKIGYFRSSTGAPVIDDYFDLGIKLYNIKFDENAHFGYQLGAWFVAYVMSEHDEQVLLDFYQNIHVDTFEDNFIMHFGTPYREYVDEFEIFLQQDPENLLSILPQ